MGERVSIRWAISPGPVSTGYAVFGACWILFSDQIIAGIAVDPDTLTWVQTFKGWFFVLATSLFFFVLMRAVKGRADEEKSLLRAILDNSTASIAMTDPRGRFLIINKEFERRYGFGPETALGKTISELFARETAEIINAAEKTVWETGEPVTEDLSVSFVDGSKRTVEFTRFPVYSASRDILGLASFSVDVTERKRVEREYRESEARLRAILDHAPVPFAVKGRDGRYQFINKKNLELLGKRFDEVVGKTSHEILPLETADTFTRMDEEVVSRREIWESENEVCYRDGECRTVWTMKFPIFDDSGEINAVGSFGIDLTEQNRIREELSKSEGLFRAVIDNCPLVIALKDLDGRYQLVNRPAKETSPVFSEDIYGKTGFDFRPRKDAENSAARDREVIETRKPQTYETWNRLSDGADHHFLVTKFPVFDGKGDLTGIGFASLETTEIKNAEDALKKSEALFRSFMDNSPLGFALKDVDGRYRMINRWLQDSYGVSEDEYVGKTNFDLRPIEAAEKALIRDREIIEGKVSLTYEVSDVGDDGEERHFIVNKFPVFDSDGELSRIGFTTLEITEMKHAQDALKESETLFRTVIDNAPVAIGLKDLDGRYQLMNRWQKQSIGMEGDDYRGKTVADFLPANVAERTEQRDREVIATRALVSYEISNVDSNGAVYHRLVNRFPVFGARGELTGIGFASLDISERIDAEQRLREMQAELEHVSRLNTLGEMAAGFAHELNQPLAAIRNYAAGAVRRIDSERGSIKDIRLAIDKIAQQALRAGDIIRRIRGFVRKEEIAKTDTDVGEVIRDSTGLLYGEALKYDVELIMDLADDLPMVPADGVQIQQVIINLARNSMEAMDDDRSAPRRVVIRTAVSGAGVGVEIEDTGKGISEDVRERLFEPFFTTKDAGMGIGLLICQTIIEEHGGMLDVAPVISGGTVVSFTLPFEKADSERSPLDRR